MIERHRNALTWTALTLWMILPLVGIALLLLQPPYYKAAFDVVFVAQGLVILAYTYLAGGLGKVLFRTAPSSRERAVGFTR